MSPRGARRRRLWWWLETERGWRLVGILVAVVVAAAMLTILSALIWPLPN